MSRWIPVNERLPEETGKCIVTAFDGVKSRSTYAHFQKTVGNFILTGRRSAWRVTAWMPMPEPYNESISNTADDEAQATDDEPVKHGMWLPHKITASSKCSLCRRVFADETPYCPNCGAIMDLKERETE
jgi:hypothetical protein